MGHSQQLRVSDFRKAAELVGEVSELGADPTAWRTHTIEGLIKLVGGQVGLTMDMQGALPGSMPSMIDPIDVGWTHDSVRRIYYDYCQNEIFEDPGALALMENHLNTKFMTRTRQQLVDDQTWYKAKAVSELRRSGDVDDFVFSSVALKPGCLHGFIVYRTWGAKKFNGRERRLMRLTHAWLFRLYRKGWDRGRSSSEVRALPPRVRQTLELVIAGDSMKRIADKLGISAHTVNDYMKALHRRLGVNTRTELMKKVLWQNGAGPLALPAGLSWADVTGN